jgi:hypothetical protein
MPVRVCVGGYHALVEHPADLDADVVVVGENELFPAGSFAER